MCPRHGSNLRHRGMPDVGSDDSVLVRRRSIRSSPTLTGPGSAPGMGWTRAKTASGGTGRSSPMTMPAAIAKMPQSIPRPGADFVTLFRDVDHSAPVLLQLRVGNFATVHLEHSNKITK